MQIYRKNQGRWTRIGTVAGIGILGVVGAAYMWEKLPVGWGTYRAIIPLVVILTLAYALFRVVNGKKSADFMIATEGEMKKVSWSSKKEIIGSTKVVIVTLLLMGFIIFLVDQGFRHFFRTIGVQQF